MVSRPHLGRPARINSNLGGPRLPQRLASRRQRVPAPQDDQSTNDRGDDAGTLVGTVQVMARPKKVATTLPTIPKTVVSTKPCGLFGDGEIHRAMKPAMAPTMMAHITCTAQS